MGRKPRVSIPYCFYHIVCCGNRRDPLFMHDGDFATFLYILKKLHEKYHFEIASFCLMTNHYHLQLRSQYHSISSIMALINKKYADYYNNRHNLTGHVYEKRFFDEVILSKKGMLEVSRYIHLNPVEASMVEKPEDYPWSSYQYFVDTEYDKQNLPFFDPHIILNEFPGTLDERKEQYEMYHLVETASTKKV